MSLGFNLNLLQQSVSSCTITMSIVVDNKVTKGTYRLLSNSKEHYREGHVKILNDITKHKILGAISSRILRINSF